MQTITHHAPSDPTTPAVVCGNPADEIAFQIAPAHHNDYEVVMQLFEAVRSYNATLDPRLALVEDWRQVLYLQFCSTYADPESGLWLLARQRSKAVGLLVVTAHLDSPLLKHRRWAEVIALYVAPECRGSGLAQQLLTNMQLWAATYGFDHVQVHAAASNERARRFYRRAGFQPVQEVLRLPV